MKLQFINNLVASFQLFVDHELLKNGEAYTNYSGKLYQTEDSDFKQFNVLGSPFRQWVSDTSIVGATIPSGIFVGANYVARGTSGLNMDYGMGRVITSPSFTPSNVSAAYSFKDLNIYYTDASESKILFETQFSTKPKNNYEAINALPSKSEPIPSIYIKIKDSYNDPFAFGGLDQTITEMRTVIIADSNGLLDATLSILNDTARKVFSVIPSSSLPFNVFGDYKSGIYNYETLNSLHLTGDNVTLINNVKVSKFDSIVNKQLGGGVYCAFVDFTLNNVRSPRKY
jgi:hypothetical protein